MKSIPIRWCPNKKAYVLEFKTRKGREKWWMNARSDVWFKFPYGAEQNGFEWLFDRYFSRGEGMNYKDEVKEVGWAFRRILGWVVLAAVVLGAVGFGLNSLGVFGHTFVERKVFEQSYQRSEALKSRIATDEAALAEIEAQLRNPNLDADTRANLEAQAAAARVRLRAARRK